MPQVVLVTGVSRYLGARLARTLCDVPTISRVIGVDALPPSRELRANLGRTEFVRADIRNPLIGKVISTAAVDTVVHMNIRGRPARLRRPVVDEGNERHRHDAAARGLPEGRDGAAADREVDDGGIRQQPA